MVDSDFDTLTRPSAAVVSRRPFPRALGRSALAAVAAPFMAAAGKAARNVRELAKRRREQCRASFMERCQGSDDCLEALLPCCEPLGDCSGIEWILPI